MTTEILGLVLDIFVLIFLGVMIFYAFRLSNSLNAFREHRSEFDEVIGDLNAAISKAEHSIENLKRNSAQEAADLNELIRKSRNLANELKDVNAVSETMASRLEALAEKNSKLAQAEKNFVPDYEPAPQPKPSTWKPPKAKEKLPEKQDRDIPSFMIRDPEFETMGRLEDRLESAVSNDEEDENYDMPENLKSQAERELFDALRKSKKILGGGRTS